MNPTLTEAERAQLRVLQKQRRDEAGYAKVTVALLLDKGRSVASIAEDLGLDDGTVSRYARFDQLHGLTKCLAADQARYWGLLTSAQLAHLCQEVNRTLYLACKGIQAWLAGACQVHYSVSGLTDLLHRLGFSCKLTTAVPCEANAAAQPTFLTELTALVAEVTRGEAALYYADAARPAHNTRCTRAWCETGHERPLPTVSGRERVNLNAALNAHAPTQGHLDETARVDAQSTRRLYEKLLAARPDTPRIYVVCDNARYYKNKELTAWLADKPIQQVFLPPDSPTLNLIERPWKFLRQKIINTSFYRTKGAFKTAVLHFFDRLPEFGPELAARMTLNFHVLDSQLTS